MSTWDASTWILAAIGAPLSPFPRKLMVIGVLAGLDRFHREPSETMVTLCSLSASLALTMPAQIRLNRNWLILLPQVTVNEIVLPLAIVSTPAEATTTAVVKAAMESSVKD
ncbi:MAG: hypothetical protein ACJ8G5_15625 [Burkholderiales bacterium]